MVHASATTRRHTRTVALTPCFARPHSFTALLILVSPCFGALYVVSKSKYSDQLDMAASAAFDVPVMIVRAPWLVLSSVPGLLGGGAGTHTIAASRQSSTRF